MVYCNGYHKMNRPGLYLPFWRFLVKHFPAIYDIMNMLHLAEWRPDAYRYLAWIFAVLFFPGALLPVDVWRQPRSSTVAFVPLLSLLAGRTLDSSFSLCSFLSFSTRGSLGSSLPRAAQVSFSSVTSRGPRESRYSCYVCPCTGLSATTEWRRLCWIEKSNQ